MPTRISYIGWKASGISPFLKRGQPLDRLGTGSRLPLEDYARPQQAPPQKVRHLIAAGQNLATFRSELPVHALLVNLPELVLELLDLGHGELWHV